MLNFIQTRRPMQWAALASWVALILAGYAIGLFPWHVVALYFALLIAAVWAGHETSRGRV